MTTPPGASLEWEDYFRRTTNLVQQPDFMQIVSEQKFFPVKISWEDIGRYQNSSWGDRISDVGIWVRLVESEPSSAKLALSVRRDSNFRDKVLVVPADRIKVHLKVGGRTEERTLPQRLGELGLSSPNRDRNVIVSNQFAIVPVPARTMRGAWADGHPPRAAFTFSIFPYGSTNYVITDVIEGSSEAIVGPGNHQLLFSNVNGQKAPFTASRAADRPDLLKMEADLKSAGMDVDVQRYYLIQVPLRRDARGIRLSNMGTPPFERLMPVAAPYAAMPAGVAGAGATKQAAIPSAAEPQAGLDKVAIGHGEVEGPYFGGAGLPRRARRRADSRDRRLLRHAGRGRHAGRHGELREGVRRMGRSGHLGRQLRRQGEVGERGIIERLAPRSEGGLTGRLS